MAASVLWPNEWPINDFSTFSSTIDFSSLFAMSTEPTTVDPKSLNARRSPSPPDSNASSEQWLTYFQQFGQDPTPSTSGVNTPAVPANVVASSSHSSSSRDASAIPEVDVESQRWRAVLARDSSMNIPFFYCVKSTKIFCRPDCPSRRPVRVNVEFARTSKEAIKKGYRACRRCRPDEVFSASEEKQVLMIMKVKEMIETAQASGSGKCPTLQELSDGSGMSKYYLLRTFKKIVGQTPDQYAKSTAAEQAQLPPK